MRMKTYRHSNLDQQLRLRRSSQTSALTSSLVTEQLSTELTDGMEDSTAIGVDTVDALCSPELEEDAFENGSDVVVLDASPASDPVA